MREKRFWDWFAGQSDRIFHFESDPHRVFAELSRELSRVEQGLTFEFGPVSDGRREFVISADGDRKRFPAVERLAAAAPPLSQWIIVPFRQPRDLEDFHDVRVNDVTLSIDDIWFSYGRVGSRVDLDVFIRGLNARNEQQLTGAAFLLLDLALGEYVVETYVGEIGWHSLPSAPEQARLLPFPQIIKVVPTTGQ